MSYKIFPILVTKALEGSALTCSLFQQKAVSSNESFPNTAMTKARSSKSRFFLWLLHGIQLERTLMAYKLLLLFSVIFYIFFYKLFFLLWRTLLVSLSLTASDNKQGIKKFIWSQISLTVVCIDCRSLSWLQNTLILNQCQSDSISVTVLLCHLPVHVYYRTILSLSYFPTFFSDSNPTTPSKKIPYLRLALGKRPKWHLGRFILEGWAPWYTCGSLLTQGPNKPSLCLNRNFKCYQRYVYRVIYRTVLKTDQSNTRKNLNFCHLSFVS